MNIKEEVKEIERLSRIITILFQEGLDYLVYELELHSVVPVFHRIRNRLRIRARKSFEHSLINSIRRLGGIFVKGGQILSTRPDIVPKEFAHMLEELQDHDIPFKFRHAKSIIEKELKKPLDEIFERFNKKPVSAASLGQVHKAVLKGGTAVAVKVQRPGIEETVKIDLKLLKWVLNRIKKKKPELKKYNLDEAYNELKRYTLRELDYSIEAKNIAKFEKFFRNDSSIIIPHVYDNVSTKKVLVMNWEGGAKPEKLYGKKDGKAVEKLGISSMVRQYFELGTFQGDPHPGNFLVTKDLNLVYLDLGMIGSFDSKTKKNALELFIDLLNGDAESVTSKLAGMNMKKGNANLTRLFASNKALIDGWHGRKVKEYTISRLIYNLILNALDEGIKLPPSFILFGKSIVTIENVGVSLNPEMDLIKEVKPVMLDIVRRKQGLRALLKFRLRGMEMELEKKLKGLPRKAEKLAERFIDSL